MKVTQVLPIRGIEGRLIFPSRIARIDRRVSIVKGLLQWLWLGSSCWRTVRYLAPKVVLATTGNNKLVKRTELGLSERMKRRKLGTQGAKFWIPCAGSLPCHACSG